MAVYYIGSFPPEYGGVTIKNKNLYEALEKRLELRKIDLNLVKRGSIREIFRLLWAMMPGNRYLIGLSGRKSRRAFTKLLYCFKRAAMKNSVLILMGGIAGDLIAADPDYLKMASLYRRIYVELPGMAKPLEKAGLCNVSLYPNGRPMPRDLQSVATEAGPLRCVFFSRIQPEKGVDLILQAAQKLPEYQFDFFGEIEPSYQQHFCEEIAKISHAAYCGVFAGTSEDVYQKLSEYDVLLLPTRWRAEGLPGILIEAKIAGVPAVVTDHNFNREVVSDGVDGIVLREGTAENLISTLQMMDKDRSLLHAMRCASRKDAEKYDIDICIAPILQDLE